MNDKVVTQPVAKRLKEAGWVKETEMYHRFSLVRKRFTFCTYIPGSELNKLDYLAPDLLDITREIREMINNRQPTITDATIIIAYEKFKCILSQKNEVDEAAEIWIEMKKEGL